MRYDDPFNYSRHDGEEQNLHSALIYTAGALALLLLGLLGNGVLAG